jgi:hypothetical protein
MLVVMYGTMRGGGSGVYSRLHVTVSVTVMIGSGLSQ